MSFSRTIFLGVVIAVGLALAPAHEVRAAEEPTKLSVLELRKQNLVAMIDVMIAQNQDPVYEAALVDFQKKFENARSLKETQQITASLKKYRDSEARRRASSKMLGGHLAKVETSIEIAQAREQQMQVPEAAKKLQDASRKISNAKEELNPNNARVDLSKVQMLLHESRSDVKAAYDLFKKKNRP